MATPDRIPPPGPDQERARLIEALVAIIGARGFADTTIEMVTERAQLDPPEFYRHFQDLPDGFLAAWDELSAGYARRVRAAYENEGAWRDGLRAAFHETLRCAAEHPGQARFLCLDVLQAGASARGRRDALMRELAGLVDAGREQLDDPDPIPYSTAVGIVGAAYNRISTALRRSATADLEGLAPELMCFAVMPYLGVEAGLEELNRPTD